MVICWLISRANQILVDLFHKAICKMFLKEKKKEKEL